MCTVSWFETEEGYELFFNRDELRSRLPAEAPRVCTLEGVRVIAPVDADAGGTWIAANELGLTLGLLNAWHVRLEEPVAGFRSRGLLVRDLCASLDVGAVRARMAALDASRYRGFTLLAFSPGEKARAFSWDGEAVRELAPGPPVVSSSRDHEQALRLRRETFARHCSEDAQRTELRSRFEAFHRSQEPEPGPWAVCMRREDAATVSASHVEVTAAHVRFRYAGGPPDETPFGSALELSRRAGDS